MSNALPPCFSGVSTYRFAAHAHMRIKSGPPPIPLSEKTTLSFLTSTPVMASGTKLGTNSASTFPGLYWIDSMFPVVVRDSG